jgi:hypothetical protein
MPDQEVETERGAAKPARGNPGRFAIGESGGERIGFHAHGRRSQPQRNRIIGVFSRTPGSTPAVSACKGMAVRLGNADLRRSALQRSARVAVKFALARRRRCGAQYRQNAEGKDAVWFQPAE